MRVKSLFFPILFCFFAGSVYASDYFDFSLSSSLQYKKLSIEESVLENDSYISKLIWNQPFNLSYNFQPKISFRNFNVSGNFSLAFPVKSGNLKDYDYLTANINEISQYSQHDLYLDKDFSCGIDLSYDFKIKSFHIIPGVKYSYINRKFSAQDGFLQYPDFTETPWTGNEKKEYLSGNIISYEQAIYYPSVILDLNYEFLNMFECGINGEFKFLANSYSLDSHYLRLVQFYDYFKNGLGFTAGTYFSYKIYSCKIRLDLGYDYFYVTGKSAENIIGKTEKQFNKVESLTSKMENHGFYLCLGVEFYPFSKRK